MESNEMLDAMIPQDWAKYVLDNKAKFVILDSETTGLDDGDVIIELGIIDLEGDILLNTYIKPPGNVEISSGAQNIHKISEEMLRDKPEFHEIYDMLTSIFDKRIVLIYNAEFDQRLVMQTCIAAGLPLPSYSALCVMKKYSEYVGEWSDTYGSYRFQKLIGGDHTAIGDCSATLKVIKKMAKTKSQVKHGSQAPIGAAIARDLMAGLQKTLEKEQKKKRAREITELSGRKWWEFWK